MRFLSNTLFFLFLVGVLLIFHETLREEGTIYSHFLMSLYIIFGFGGAALVLKKYVYYQYADGIRVAFLGKRSLSIDNLLFKIILISLIALMNIYLYNWGLDNSHSWFLLLSAIVGILGVSLNIHPALLMTSDGFYYDDYIPIKWKWKEVQSIEFHPSLVIIRGKYKDFEVDLSLLQKEDSLFNRFLQTDVQQFGGGPEDFQKWLHSYAKAHGLACSGVGVRNEI